MGNLNSNPSRDQEDRFLMDFSGQGRKKSGRGRKMIGVKGTEEDSGFRDGDAGAWLLQMKAVV